MSNFIYRSLPLSQGGDCNGIEVAEGKRYLHFRYYENASGDLVVSATIEKRTRVRSPSSFHKTRTSAGSDKCRQFDHQFRTVVRLPYIVAACDSQSPPEFFAEFSAMNCRGRPNTEAPHWSNQRYIAQNTHGQFTYQFQSFTKVLQKRGKHQSFRIGDTENGFSRLRSDLTSGQREGP